MGNKLKESDVVYDSGSFTITKREILAAVSIIAILLLVGILISNYISDKRTDRNMKYDQAYQIDNDPDEFRYCMDTDIGNAFVYGDLKAVDTVSFSEVTGEYMYIEKVTEKYTMHTRVVHTGKTTTTQTYWTWDEIDSEEQCSKKVNFCGIEFDLSDICDASEFNEYIDTVDAGYHLRHVYYGSPTSYTGTLYANLKDKTVKDAEFYNDRTIDQTIDHLESSAGEIIFWIFWILLIVGCAVGFFVIDNKWLE